MCKKYYFDKPKTNEQEDMLVYTKFLDQIFAYIEYFLSKNDSTIIGFAANWGDGKTTIMNFLKERIKSKYKNENQTKNVFNTAYVKALILKEIKHFAIYAVLIFAAGLTVWQYKDNIVLLTWIWVFIFLFIMYKYPNWRESLQKIKNSVFLEKDYIILDFESWSSQDENQVIEEFLKTLSDKIDLADGSEDFNKYIKAILKYKNIDLDILSNDDSITVLYERLKKSLQNSNKKIIVFIDDMDRMTGKEIFCLLKLVKVVANFPNTLYILSYNKDYVARELAQVISYNPEEYLEKIITNEYRLPNIKPEQISEILITELDKIIGSDTDNYDRKNINIILESIIPYFIPNLRKAYRILNAFNFHYELFLKANVLINIADLLYLTVLKVFNLNLYNRIWNDKANIINAPRFNNDEEKKKYQEKYIIGYIERESLSAAEISIMNKLFNNIDSLTKDVKRLNNPNHFDLYFSYEIEKSQISKIKNWLLNFSPENPQADDFEHSKTMWSDLQDLMYSNLYYKYRDTNFALGLIELMIRNPKLAKDLYVENTKLYFNGINQQYIKDTNITKIADFIDKNKTRCEINLLEWLLFDCLFYDGTSEINSPRMLPALLEKIKISLQQELKTKLEKCNIRDIYSIHTIERLTSTYGFIELVKNKFLELLQESDIAVVSALHQFTTVGHSSTVGVFYNLYIIDKIMQLGIGEKYRQRLLEIKENDEIMNNARFIDYYSGNKEFATPQKQHIVDKALDIIEKHIKHAAENTIDNK